MSDFKRRLYRHVKTGRLYQITSTATLEKTGEAVVIYSLGHEHPYALPNDQRLWVRPEAEFHDGRFEAVAETFTYYKRGTGLWMIRHGADRFDNTVTMYDRETGEMKPFDSRFAVSFEREMDAYGVTLAEFTASKKELKI